ncbi:MAG TPA: malate dehydrogenase [Nitrospirae bacterium]|nr:malate dehydrogenase [Nitrospirota bacterium]
MKKKVSIIGAGNVGASLAQLLVYSGICDVVLFDIVNGVPQGKALDLSEACPLWGSSINITGTNDYKDTAGSDVIVITAGLARKPGMSRDDLLSANAKVVADVAKNTCQLSRDAIFIVVTNPMDVMAQVTLKVTGFNPDMIIGMGGILDSARFRTFVAWELGIAPEDVEALVMGGHGDQMVPMPRFTTAKGISITHLISEDRINKLIERTKNGGAEIVGLLKTGSAFYAPSASTFQMVKSVILDEKRLLPCSAYLNGQYGLKGYYAGVPVILGKKGVEKIIELPLNEQEKSAFEKSFEAVKGLVQNLNTMGG